MTSYVNQYGTEFAVQKHDGAPSTVTLAPSERRIS